MGGGVSQFLWNFIANKKATHVVCRRVCVRARAYVCVRVYVCACEWCACVVCACECVRAWVRVCVRAYVCVRVCVRMYRALYHFTPCKSVQFVHWTSVTEKKYNFLCLPVVTQTDYFPEGKTSCVESYVEIFSLVNALICSVWLLSFVEKFRSSTALVRKTVSLLNSCLLRTPNLDVD
jgi:hypothetical protein